MLVRLQVRGSNLIWSYLHKYTYQDMCFLFISCHDCLYSVTMLRMPPTSSLLDSDSSDLNPWGSNASSLEIRLRKSTSCSFSAVVHSPPKSEACHGASIFYVPLYRVPTTGLPPRRGENHERAADILARENEHRGGMDFSGIHVKNSVLKEPRSPNV
jgi:hypothetical protein